jgi:glutathione peroxidase
VAFIIKNIYIHNFVINQKYNMSTFHQLRAKKLNGKELDFNELRGKTVLIVNTASKCGFTPQLKQLQDLYAKYQPKGLEIIAFPSDQFMGQEPLEGKGISEFCEINYGVSFPIMEKSKVRGGDKNEVFDYLTDKSKNGKSNQQPWWNFWKYLVGPDGKLVDVFSSITKPTDKKIIQAIEKSLK